VIAPQQGQVISLSVTPGQKVQTGQVIAVLKPTSSQAEQVGIETETGRLRVEIDAAETELAAAQKEYQRLEAISDIAAKKDVQAAQARLRTAEANLKAQQTVAGGSVAAANNNIILKSPITGTVGQFSLSKGSEVPSGATLFSITNLSQVFIEAQVYDRDAEIVNDAERYTATCSNADHGTADVRMIGTALEVNQTNQSQKVLFALQNPEQEFKIGEFVTIRAFQRNMDKVVFVPNSALSEINGKPVLFIKDAPEKYAVRYIAPGQDNGTHTIVMKGLEESERFVTSATYQVKMMMLNQ
jgi:RND family efflux transporter MFP subunit